MRALYAAYATSSNPVGAELDAGSAAYGGSVFNSRPIQALRPEQNKAGEVGTKWELFDRHLLVTGALFQTEKTNARRDLSGVNIIAGAAYRVQRHRPRRRRQDHRPWSIFGGLRPDGHRRSCSRSIAAHDRAPAGQHRASVVQRADQVQVRPIPWRSAGRRPIARRSIGGTFLAANQRTTCCRATGASMPSSSTSSQRTSRPSSPSTTSSNQSITTRSIAAHALRVHRARPVGMAGPHRQALNRGC